jgi:hypothetical protein
MTFAFDEHGYPVLLSNRKFTVEPPFDADFLAHANQSDPSVGIQPKKPTTVVEPLELARRRDAVREAAREFEDLSDQDVRERLAGKTKRELTVDEVAQFRSEVRTQVLDDLVDMLDQSTRGRLRSRRTVRVVAPKGYRVKLIRGLSADEQDEVEDRLKARGWTDQDVLSVLPETRKL